MEGKRLVWLDFLKGFLILLVILGHAIQYCMKEDSFETNYWWNLIYSFHMPVFMAASGFISFKPSTSACRGGVTTFKRRTYQLLVPFFSWSVIKWLTSANLTLNSLIHLTFSSGGFFWFLWVLWCIVLLCMVSSYISWRFNIKKELIIAIASSLLIATMLSLNSKFMGIHYIAYYFIFYNVGYFANKYRNAICDNKYVIILCGFLWFILASYWKMHQIPTILSSIKMIPTTIILYGYRIITALLAIYILLIGIPYICNRQTILINAISKYGQNSLAIYGLQGIVVIQICEFISITFSNLALLGCVLISFGLTILFTILSLNLLNKQKLISMLLFGKIPHSQYTKSVMYE